MNKTANANPLKITDVTFRDGHQSVIATRMRTDDMIGMAAEMDSVGFYSMEVWGGATFDVAMRFLNEDPWDRLRTLRKLIKVTPLQMLLRGQNLVGYRNYADDVVTAFVHYAAKCGIDIFRVFDALNDERNLESSLKAIKECGKLAQLAICYSLTEPKMGGPIFNLDYYVSKALVLQKMGADSICIKDMAGLIAPDDAYNLVRALKDVLSVPVQLHTHYTSGMGSMACWQAAEAGVDALDTSLAPFALRSGPPAVEPIVAALRGTPRETGLSVASLLKLGGDLESVAPKYRDFINSTKMSIIDTGVLAHQIPGGMISNLVAQLREQHALNRLNEVYEEIARVRKELGYPPLVTPTSQIIGVQAVQNMIVGRYKLVTTQLMDYCSGMYGRPPAPIDPDVQKMVLKHDKRGQTPTTGRPGDLLEPELDKARENIKAFTQDTGDILINALYPITGLRFLKWKHGLAKPPDETKPRTMDDVQREDNLIARAKAGKLVEKE